MNPELLALLQAMTSSSMTKTPIEDQRMKAIEANAARISAMMNSSFVRDTLAAVLGTRQGTPKFVTNIPQDSMGVIAKVGPFMSNDIGVYSPSKFGEAEVAHETYHLNDPNFFDRRGEPRAYAFTSALQTLRGIDKRPYSATLEDLKWGITAGSRGYDNYDGKDYYEALQFLFRSEPYKRHPLAIRFRDVPFEEMKRYLGPRYQ